MKTRALLFLMLLLCWAITLRAGDQPTPQKAIPVPHLELMNQLRLRDPVEQELREREKAMRPFASPELIVWHETQQSTVERRDTSRAGLDMPINDHLRLSLGLVHRAYRLDPAEEAELDSRQDQLYLRASFVPDIPVRPWSTAHVYKTDGNTHFGLDTGAAWSLRPNITLTGYAACNLPWLESTYSLDADGRRSHAGLDLSWQKGRWLVSAGGERAHYRVGDKAPGNRYGGWSSNLRFRSQVALWQEPVRALGTGFVSLPDFDDGALYPGFFLYAAIDADRHHSGDNFTAVPVTGRSVDLRTGVEYNLLLTRNLALSVDAYLGQDHPRAISWNRLYGGRSRLVFVPGERCMIWTEVASNADGGNAFAAGREESFRLGFHLSF